MRQEKRSEEKIEIMSNKILGNLRDFINWHLPWSVATWHQIEEHFNLTATEIAMLEACIQYKIIKEVYIEAKGVLEKDKLYITLKVSEVRKLINLRRRNIGN